ncbi:hypothetical protein SERLADRAFT_444328 [Serpula lacrymans var. lacrymans S7.9]|uniref:Histone deacetylase interacting domain-containing protein n=1 Tax=Serpula lacrymans var. lacrymans (strain S7.9) TaxID=578457 RepID=F8NDN5_SERL9|nr:uncharacterized protein SERLADRAFT_444328 [Serpula lacrymans var. lacrymans S7.9]EGO30319.1 hypothetical protein SERLADRAFT_444328 [Serpula lacrymans var. lacrymans S7.9]
MSKAKTSKPSTPRPPLHCDNDNDPPGSQQRSSEMNRPLNVTDALSYLDAVKVQFQDKPDVYNHFLDIMKDFKSEVIDTPGVIERVSLLFHGNPYLIQGFNTFLPPGYRIEMSEDPREINFITVTTPTGTTTQNTSAWCQSSRQSRDGLGPARPSLPGHNFVNIAPQSFMPPLSRSITPYQLSHMQPPFDGPSVMYSPSFQGHSTTAAASFLGNLNNKHPVENKPAGEFNHAIQYLNKIKARYADDPDTYKQFLEILQTYQKEQRHLHDSQVYVQVQMLFKDAPDLLSEFKDFLPEVANASAGPSGVVGILPHPTAGPGVPSPWNQPDMSTAASEKGLKKAALTAKKRRRGPEKDTTPALNVKGSLSRSKKTKLNNKADPESPRFSPYPVPGSPLPHAASVTQAPGVMQPPQGHGQHSVQAFTNSSYALGSSTPDELLFFDRAKKALEGRETYEDFLKILNLYSKDIIDAKMLVDMARAFLGDGELLTQFKDVIGVDEKRSSIEFGPPGSIRTGPPEALSALPADDGKGPSYRRLPKSEIRLACSGRDQLCRSVLNDEWVSHPTWASEEAGFIAHKKNSFEEALHKSEEERHEYHVHIEALTRTIAILSPIAARIEEMTNEERAAFRLKPDLGGSSKSIYYRIIKKVYGRDTGNEVIQALQDCPSVAVPVILARLKQKDDEWRRAQRDWSKTWREVDAKNFYKSLDYQGISFKANDKKSITAKHFVGHIESIKADQARVQAEQGRPSFVFGSLGHQLEFRFYDISVLHDSLKMVYAFLEHSQGQYSLSERRAIENWLRSFVPLLCMYPVAEFNAACGPLGNGREDNSGNELLDESLNGRRFDGSGNAHSSGIPANDLRKQLLKTVQEKSYGNDASGVSPLAQSRATSPFSGISPPNAPDADNRTAEAVSTELKAEDIWIHDCSANPPPANNTENASRKPFFANTTFYTMLCLLQLLYSRLCVCKESGAKQAYQRHTSLQANSIAVELGLDDPNGPSAVLAQAMDALGDGRSDDTNVIYMYLLDACEKLFDNELDQVLFEEHMRWFFGNKAYHLFTLDKLITALVKQVQTVLSDNKCQEIWSLLQQTRSKGLLSNQDIIRYRREAERHVGSDEHLYRVAWHRDSKMMYMQLVDQDDPSIDGDGSAINRWREYVDAFVLRQPSEWQPVPKKTQIGSVLFLRRSRYITTDESPPCASRLWNGMRIRISLGTYKLFYEGDSEDVLVRGRGAEEGEGLSERARVRQEERKKSRWLQE